MSRVAAIDCGTNSIRLLIADVTKRDDGTAWLRDVHREMQIVRLGQGVDATGRLHPDAIERTKAALADYARTMHVVLDYVATRPAIDRDAVLGGNAARFWRLDETRDSGSRAAARMRARV